MPPSADITVHVILSGVCSDSFKSLCKKSTRQDVNESYVSRCLKTASTCSSHGSRLVCTFYVWGWKPHLKITKLCFARKSLCRCAALKISAVNVSPQFMFNPPMFKGVVWNINLGALDQVWSVRRCQLQNKSWKQPRVKTMQRSVLLKWNPRSQVWVTDVWNLNRASASSSLYLLQLLWDVSSLSSS